MTESIADRFNKIQSLIARNDFTQAMSLAEELRTIPESRKGATSLFALAAAMGEARDKALEALAELADPEEIRQAETLVATGSAWFRLNEPVEAVRFLSAAVAVSSEHPLARARLGACLLALGRIPEALPHLERAVQLLPTSGGAGLNLSRAYLAMGRYDDALKELDRSEPFPDKELELYRMSRVEALAALERHDEAESILRQSADEGSLASVTAAVSMMASRGKHDEAWHVLKDALEKYPDETQLMEMAAEFAQVRGRFAEAGRWLNKALSKQPENALLWARLAVLSGRRLGDKAAREAADKSLELTQESPAQVRAIALNAHAHVLSEEGDTLAAESAYREALSLYPRCIPAMNGLGHLLMQLGKVEEATALFEELKDIAPLQGWSQLISAREVPEDPQVLDQMEKAAKRPSMEGPVQSHLLFTLASAWEKKGDYEKAWSFASQANSAARTHLPYRPELHRARIEREMARFSAEFMKSRKEFGSDSSLPTFVLGMPRSGTTLVEQILGSHSKVFGAGELSIVPEFIQKLNAWEAKLGTRRQYPECIDDMGRHESRRFAEKHIEELKAYAPTAERIVDKLPHNFEHIGLIKLIFPNARILHLKREPRDVAMSNYFVDYAAKFGGMGFAYDLSHIGEQLVDHQRLMNHWHKVFPGQILEVDYDLLVEDVEGWAHKIIDYLGLEWEDGVLAFQELDRAVKTASVWQVRQPVYTTSKAKWKRYEQFLEPLEAALSEIPPMPDPLPLPKLEPALFLAGMEALQKGESATAEISFKALLAARPAHAAAHHFLGAALYQQGRIDEARKEMKRSLELYRGQKQWIENLAALEEHSGNSEEAEKLRNMLNRRDLVRDAGDDQKREE